MVVSTSDVVLSSCHNKHEHEQSPTGGVFEPVRGTPVRNVPRRGTSQTSRGGGVSPRASIPKRGTWSHPTLITLVHALYTQEKQNSGLFGGAQGARPTLQICIWSRFDGEHGRRRRRNALSPFLSRFWGGLYPFLSNAVYVANMISIRSYIHMCNTIKNTWLIYSTRS